MHLGLAANAATPALLARSGAPRLRGRPEVVRDFRTLRIAHRRRRDRHRSADEAGSAEVLQEPLVPTLRAEPATAHAAILFTAGGSRARRICSWRFSDISGMRTTINSLAHWPVRFHRQRVWRFGLYSNLRGPPQTFTEPPYSLCRRSRGSRFTWFALTTGPPLFQTKLPSPSRNPAVHASDGSFDADTAGGSFSERDLAISASASGTFDTTSAASPLQGLRVVLTDNT